MDFKVFIEIPAGGSIKYEVDEETGELTLDRYLHTSMVYPANYGFIKDTEGQDGDPLDALVISQSPAYPGVVVKCHAIGLLEMEDEGGIDTKIIAVPDKKIDPIYGAWEDIKDVPQPTLSMIKHFFDHMKELEQGKWVKTGDYKAKSDAESVIGKSEKTSTSTQ